MATDLLILRDQIDAIDKQIVELYEKRVDVCKEVAEYKIETGKKVFDKVREAEKIEKVKAMASTEFNKHAVQELFEQIQAKKSMLCVGLDVDFDKMPEVWIYVGELGDEKTVSEVLKNRSFGDGPNDLKIAFKTKSMVDAGETLTNDYSGEIKDYWLPIYDNAIKEGKPLKEILDTFSVISNLTTTVSIPTNELENLTQDTIERVLIDCWNLDNVRADLFVGDKNKESENLERAEKLFVISGIKDTNFLKGLYYPELYKDLGIDLKKLVKNAVQEVKGIKVCHDFDHYLKYLDYWKNPGRVDTNKCCSKQRVKSTNYKLDVVTLKDLYGDSELKDTIIGAVNKVREDFGLGATEYNLINIGNKKEPKEYIICKLTLDDLIKFKKGVSKMSETLKNEILENHFVWVQVVFDKDGIIN